MTTDAWMTLVTLTITMAVLLLDRYPPVYVLAGAVAGLLFVGVIDTPGALSGLSATAPATIAALYVLAGAVTATGLFGDLVDRLLDRRRPLLALTAVTASISSVVPNTPLVAMLAPRVVRWSQRHGATASRFLLPLSFASILGGVITLIGTSTNLVVAELFEQAGYEPLGVFDVTAVGLPVAIVGVVVLSVVGDRLLPERTASSDDVSRRGREFQIAARVEPTGPLVGRTIAESGLRSLDGVFLALIERADGVDDDPAALAVSPHTVLRANDVCCFVGDVGRVVDLHALDGLTSLEDRHVSGASGPGTRLFEAVVAPASELIGATLRSAAFRGRYGGAVMAIHRADGELAGQLGRIALRAGDVLLVLADDAFGDRWRNHADFSLVAAAEESPPERRGSSLLVGGAIVGMIVASAVGVLTLFEAALAAAIVVVAGRALSANEALRSINVTIVLTIAVSISLGHAVASSGLAAEIASLVEHSESLGLGVVGVVAVMMIATIVLTELVTNTAAAALMVPIGLRVATEVGADPKMFAIAVMIGASCSFLSPIGYQTNLMVYGLGGYRFTDFTRVGLPLTISTLSVSVVALPLVYG